MLSLGKRTGYEIKSLGDVSTRFFWAASYGQIYPELRRQNRNLKNQNQSLSGEVNELNRNIDQLKRLDQELEKKRR